MKQSHENENHKSESKTNKAKKAGAAAVAVLALGGAFAAGRGSAPDASEKASASSTATSAPNRDSTTSTSTITTEAPRKGGEFYPQREAQIAEYDSAVDNEVRYPMLSAVNTIRRNPESFPNITISEKPSQFEKDEKDIFIRRVLDDGSIISLEIYGSDARGSDITALEHAKGMHIMQQGPVGSVPSHSDNPEGRERVGRVQLYEQGLSQSGKFNLDGEGISDRIFFGTNWVGNLNNEDQVNMDAAMACEATAAQTTAALLNTLFS